MTEETRSHLDGELTQALTSPNPTKGISVALTVIVNLVGWVFRDR